jgi:hypothetical protein
MWALGGYIPLKSSLGWVVFLVVMFGSAALEYGGKYTLRFKVIRMLSISIDVNASHCP